MKENLYEIFGHCLTNLNPFVRHSPPIPKMVIMLCKNVVRCPTNLKMILLWSSIAIILWSNIVRHCLIYLEMGCTLSIKVEQSAYPGLYVLSFGYRQL